MKFLAPVLLLTVVSLRKSLAYPQDDADKIKEMLDKLSAIQISEGAEGSNIKRLLTHALQVLGVTSDKNSLFIVDENGQLRSNGPLGNLGSALISVIASVLGGEMFCGGEHGIFLRENQGVFADIAVLLNTIDPAS